MKFKNLFFYTALFLSSFSWAEQKLSKLSEQALFTVITVLYNETDMARLNEYLICLEKNLDHPQIKTFHVLYDTTKDNDNTIILNYLKEKKVKITYINDRPTFGFCFELANSLYPNSNIIISNADIYFNDTLKLLTGYSLENKFLALTRWNLTKEGNLIPYIWPDGRKGEYSQDSWIFETPLKSFLEDNIQLGIPHCDGRIAFEAQRAGLQVLNPCISLQCCHVHLTGKHNYSALPYPRGKAIKVEWTTL